MILSNLKKQILLIINLLIFIPCILISQTNNTELLEKVRIKLPDAFQNDEACSLLLKEVKDVKSPEPLLKGYIGGIYIARSKHAPLLDKMHALKTGTKMLEESIKEKPNNIELLFLRLTIQLNLPGFLGYDDDIDSDKNFVLHNYKVAPPILKARIVNFVKTSGFFSEEEQKLVAG